MVLQEEHIYLKAALSSMGIKYFEHHITITIGCNSNTPNC